jgi:hypothetical protein
MAKQARKAKKTKPASRARRKLPAQRRGAPAKPAAKPHKKRQISKQTFVASHHSPGAFEVGLRRYAHYRDLGIASATNGMVRAHVIKFVPPFVAAEVSKRHYHDVEFQMVYVLKGWMTSEFEGQGAITMREGSCWIQPPKIKHTVLDYSDDCEVLEIILPADFDTVELE